MAETIQKKDPFDRPPRLQDAFTPIELDLPEPPTKPEEGVQNFLMSLLPMSSYLVMGIFYAASMRSTGGVGMGMGVMMLIFPIVMLISTYFVTGSQKHQRKQSWIKQLRAYQRLLDKKEARLLAGRELQQSHLHNRFRPPTSLLRRVEKMQISLWERRPEDPDFLAFRIGIGKGESVVNTKPPDPDSASKFIRRPINLHVNYRALPDVPLVFDLQQVGSVAFVGNRNETVPAAHTFVSQLATLNSPEDVHLYVFSDRLYYKIWKWIRWLPHTSESHRGGDPTFIAFSSNARRRLLDQIAKKLDEQSRSSDEEENSPKKLAQSMVILFDKEGDIREQPLFSQILKSGKGLGIYSVFICDRMEDIPSECESVIAIDKKHRFKYSITGTEGFSSTGTVDRVRLLQVDNLAHRLLPIAARALGRSGRIPPKVNMLQLYSVKDDKKVREAQRVEEIDILSRWLDMDILKEEDGLLPYPVSIGNESYAQHLEIHLAENKDGPHGLVAGTTGSGKSELLQTIVTSLAIEHHPYFVNFLLIDFKGGSTFSLFEKMPHVVGFVSNLDKPSANRALEAIKAENLRRQEFLDKQGDEVDDIIEYHRKLARKGALDASWEPLPHLFIVVDEFAQMAKDMPNFLPELVEIGRIGRSLGIHLILATQRPAGVIKDDMRANLNFRISLRVQTIDDSRDVLRRPDAAHLPSSLPGRAYFQLGDTGVAKQFQVARVGGEYNPNMLESQAYSLYRLNYEEKVSLPISDDELDESKNQEQDVLAVALANRMTELYADTDFGPMEKILLPPLDEKIPVQKVLYGNNWKENWKIGWKERWAAGWVEKKEQSEAVSEASMFSAPIGLLDSLATHTQPPLHIDFLKQGGHAMIVGAPQTGKTFFLETLCYSLVNNYSPSQLNMYVLSFAGRGLDALQGLPHVGSVIEGTETEKFQRLLRHLENEIDARKGAFSEAGVKDLTEYNLSEGVSGLPYIIVMIDNFGELRNMEYDDEQLAINKILKSGREYGIHFVITALQGSDIPYKTSNLIQQRLALDLTDRSEYVLLIGRMSMTDFDSLPAGRCFVKMTPPQICQIGLPVGKDTWSLLSPEMTSHAGESKAVAMEELSTDISLLELLELESEG